MPPRRWNWPESSADRYHGDKVEGFVWHPAPDLFVTRVIGHADLGAVRFYVTRAQSAILAGHKISVFHDWSQITTYDRQARDRLRSFAAQNDAAFRGVYYLVASKIIMMAISAAAVALGRSLYAYTNPDEFNAKLDEALTASLHPAPG